MRVVDQTELVSVVIPCRDRPELLRRCLDSLSSQIDAGPCEVIVVDSSSGDQVRDVIAQHANVHRVAAPAPLGASEARNLGARQSHGNILAFIDADCLAAPGWLSSARASLARGTRIAGGAILDQRPWSPFAAAGHFVQLSECGPGRPAGSVTRLSGAQLVMHRSTFEDLRGFPTGRGEDVRFTTAAHRRWPDQVRFEPAMVIWHASSSELYAFWTRSWQLGFDRAKTGPTVSMIARLGPSAAGAFVASVARVGYIAWCTARWRPRSLLRFLLFSPIVALGCLRWGFGLKAGTANSRDGH